MPVQEIDLADTLRKLELEQLVAQLAELGLVVGEAGIVDRLGTGDCCSIEARFAISRRNRSRRG